MLTSENFMLKFKKFKAKVSKELILQIIQEFTNPKLKLVDVVAMKQKYFSLFPDSTPPPVKVKKKKKLKKLKDKDLVPGEFSFENILEDGNSEIDVSEYELSVEEDEDLISESDTRELIFESEEEEEDEEEEKEEEEEEDEEEEEEEEHKVLEGITE